MLKLYMFQVAITTIMLLRTRYQFIAPVRSVGDPGALLKALQMAIGAVFKNPT